MNDKELIYAFTNFAQYVKSYEEEGGRRLGIEYYLIAPSSLDNAVFKLSEYTGIDSKMLSRFQSHSFNKSGEFCDNYPVPGSICRGKFVVNGNSLYLLKCDFRSMRYNLNMNNPYCSTEHLGYRKAKSKPFELP